MAYYVPPSQKVGGHVPRVPQRIAPMQCIIRKLFFSVDERGIGLNIFKWNVFHAHVVYQLKNGFPSDQYFAWLLLKQLFYLMLYLSSIFGINVMKGQNDFRSINYLPTVNEKILHQWKDYNPNWVKKYITY